jgi:aryl-alcohol dehydrogenase-like predicted oxidoreductase
MMNYHRLGRTNWKVSALGLGGAALGDEFGAISPAQAADTVAAALDAGINFFDTAAQ